MNPNCPSEFDVCDTRQVGGGNYTYVRGKATPVTSNRIKVEARKTKPGAYIALVRRIKEHEKEGIPYSFLNKYFRGEFGKTDNMNPMGIGYASELLTYDPRYDDVKTYSQVLDALGKAPESLDWLQLWDIIEDLKKPSFPLISFYTKKRIYTIESNVSSKRISFTFTFSKVCITCKQVCISFATGIFRRRRKWKLHRQPQDQQCDSDHGQ